eukprot:3488546-Pyramimonas_sp.AAC.1
MQPARADGGDASRRQRRRHPHAVPRRAGGAPHPEQCARRVGALPGPIHPSHPGLVGAKPRPRSQAINSAVTTSNTQRRRRVRADV